MQPSPRVLMEPIVPLPDDIEAESDGDFRLVRVEYESGGEDFESIEVYDRVKWLDEGGDDGVWRTLAQQEMDDHDLSKSKGQRLVRVELPAWWVEKEAQDADRTDTTWRGSYGRVYGEEATFAAVDYEWSEGKAAWSFPFVQNRDGRWDDPGKYGPGGPKSLLPVVFPVGTPKVVDAEPVQRKEARDAAPASDHTEDYDWGAAYEKAVERVRQRESMSDAELDISAIQTLDDQNKVAYQAAITALGDFQDDYTDEMGAEPDPMTMTFFSEAIAHAMRKVEDLDDPRVGE